ncbi:MAG: hypothetical protein LBK63_03195 [Treponema sp.]|jgi:hypothetical protein|nr:hypothetical protein [Treponema sp.]
MKPPGPALWVFLLFFVFSALPLEAQSLYEKLGLSFRGSILCFPENNGMKSDAMPVLPSLGIAAGWPVLSFMRIELSLDFYGTYYAYSDELDRVVPVIPGSRSSFVMGSVLGVQALKTFAPGEGLRIRVYGGPAADLRLCLTASGLEGADKTEAAEETRDIAAWFWGKGRWFMPAAGAGMDFALTEKLLLGFDLRVWLPAWRLWSAEILPSVEGWRFGAGNAVQFCYKAFNGCA